MAVITLTAYVLEIQGQYMKCSSSVAEHLSCVIFYDRFIWSCGL